VRLLLLRLLLLLLRLLHLPKGGPSLRRRISFYLLVSLPSAE
jgi:hypothetical protein